MTSQYIIYGSDVLKYVFKYFYGPQIFSLIDLSFSKFQRPLKILRIILKDLPANRISNFMRNLSRTFPN